MACNKSILKAISWRVVGSLDTFFVGWFFTKHIPTATAITFVELVSKIILYYAHERAWDRIKWQKSQYAETRLRALVKAISWRIVGTLDTTLITFLLTWQWRWALQIASVEFFSKIILYYLHERIWQKLFHHLKAPSESQLQEKVR